jgi:hypothetical protein
MTDLDTQSVVRSCMEYHDFFQTLNTVATWAVAIRMTQAVVVLVLDWDALTL